MADTLDTQLVVLGAGPGGYAAAFLAADKGMKVTLIDAGARPGGTCLHVGCIPSKALLHAARLITEAREAGEWGIQFAAPKLDVAALRNREFKIVDTMATNLQELCKRRKVEYLSATASFADSHTVQLGDGSRRRFKHCIVATG